MLAVAALIALLAITILALAGARRTVLGQEPKACHEVSAPVAHSLTRC
jgi:Tfp pilus assembly protein PilX